MGIMMDCKSAKELATAKFPDTTLVDGGVLHERSRLMIAGDAGIGKSYIGLQLSWEAANGEPWLGTWPCKRKLNTLLVQVEVSEPLFQKRYLRLKGTKANPKNWWSRTDEEFVLEENYDRLRETIDSLEIELCILDPLYLMHTGDENAVHTIRPTQRIIDRIRRDFNCTFVILHHTNKSAGVPDSRPSMNMLRGSSGWAGWVDTVLLATKGSGESINLHMLKARNRQEALPTAAYSYSWNDGQGPFLLPQGTTETASLSVVIQAIEETCDDQGVSQQSDVVGWLHESYNMSSAAAYRRINELAARGFIKKQRRLLKIQERGDT